MDRCKNNLGGLILSWAAQSRKVKYLGCDPNVVLSTYPWL